MTSYERIRAITTSKIETSLRMVLVALVDHMSDTQDTCWPAVETVAERAGLCERQARELLNDAEARGLIRRWSGDHKSRDIAIVWEALAAAPAPSTSRGGSRTKPAKTAGAPANTAAQPAKTAPLSTGKDCHPNRQSLPPQPAKTAAVTGKDCPRSLPLKPTTEANQEAHHTREGTDPPAMPDNLPALLGFGRHDLTRRLVEYVQTPAQLVAMTELEVQMIPKMGAPRAALVARICADAGWPLAPPKADRPPWKPVTKGEATEEAWRTGGTGNAEDEAIVRGERDHDFRVNANMSDAEIEEQKAGARLRLTGSATGHAKPSTHTEAYPRPSIALVEPLESGELRAQSRTG